MDTCDTYTRYNSLCTINSVKRTKIKVYFNLGIDLDNKVSSFLHNNNFFQCIYFPPWPKTNTNVLKAMLESC